MNRLSIDRRTQLVSALVERNTIRSIEWMTGNHRDTVMRLGFEVGKGIRIVREMVYSQGKELAGL